MHPILILHRDEELKLTTLQKELTSFLFEKNIKTYPVFPLGIIIKDKLICNLNINEIKNLIKKIIILNISNDETFIYINIEIELKDNKKINEKLDLLQFQKSQEINLKNIDLSNFKIKNPLNVRVFKIANITFNGFSWSIFNEKWIKTK